MTSKAPATEKGAISPDLDTEEVGAPQPPPPLTTATETETSEPPAKKQKGGSPHEASASPGSPTPSSSSSSSGPGRSPPGTGISPFVLGDPPGPDRPPRHGSKTLFSADAQEEEEDEDASTSTRKSPSRPPSTWAERLSRPFLSAEEAEADLDRNIAADLQGSLASISVRIERSPEYAIATIASGSANQIMLLHSVTGLTDEATGDSTGLVALLGMGKVASIFRLNPRKTFAKRHNVQVLKPAVILRSPSLNDVPATSSSGGENTEHVSIICSFQSPPWLTKEILAKKLHQASDILDVFRVKALEIVAARAKQDGSSTDDLITQLEDEDAIPIQLPPSPPLRILHP